MPLTVMQTKLSPEFMTFIHSAATASLLRLGAGVLGYKRQPEENKIVCECVTCLSAMVPVSQFCPATSVLMLLPESVSLLYLCANACVSVEPLLPVS